MPVPLDHLTASKTPTGQGRTPELVLQTGSWLPVLDFTGNPAAARFLGVPFAIVTEYE
jgi:hypothetical protein